MPIRLDLARVVLASVVLVLAGCPGTSPTDAPEPLQQGAAKVRPRVSGYAATPDDWRAFLACWHRDVAQARQHEPDLGPSLIEAPNSPRAQDDALERAIAERQRALGMALPRSYLDFVRAYRPSAEWASIRQHPGLLSIEAIDTVARLDPEGIALARRFPNAPDDGAYFVYGTDQDSIVFRAHYLERAIIVGKYGDSLYEQIVLYPQVRGEDGEMEAALLGWSGVYRAPSFAELMRQLHYLDLGRADHVPPYAQARIRGTCADLMPLKDVWWN